MNRILTGLRAGVFSALILTLCSFAGALEGMSEAETTTGILYVLSAYGLFGLPQILYGALIAGGVLLWRTRLEENMREWVADPIFDRRLAAALVSAPLLAGAVGAGVRALHLGVTSTFARETYQALGLGLAAFALTSIAFFLTPLLVALFTALIARLYPDDDGATRVPRATLTVLGMYAIAIVGGLIFAYRYALSLEVWNTGLVRMAYGALLITPILYGLMSRFDVQRLAWRVGVPVAGTAAVLIGFGGAAFWTSTHDELRSAVNEGRTLYSKTARLLQPLADGDGDGYPDHFGGVDCDDSDPDVYPGAPEEPGNGVDENCSGEDMPPPSAQDHPSRGVVSRAIDAARNRATQRAEQIPDPPPNIVFILVDTVRQDHLGYAGYERDTSPNIDSVADEATAFHDTYAPSPHTPRSIPPLFFSRYPSRMAWNGPQFNYPKIRPENLSLFEVLEEEGYLNVGMTSHFYFEEDQGIRQGFQEWDNEGAKDIAGSNDDIAAPRIWEKTEPTIEELADRWHDDKKPFSLFVHFFEPHARWIGHEEFDFGEADTERQRRINNYDSEIAFTDDYVGRIIDKLESEELYEDTILVITSDHGEAFDEHGEYFHGQNLYNEVIKVPLIIRVPGWHSRSLEGPVSLIDVPPTLLELVDVSIPSEFEGESLVEAMMGQSEVPGRPVFAELLPYTNWKERHQAIIDGDYKFIEIVTSGLEELYDLEEDPGEQNDLSDEEPERAESLKERLYEFIEAD
ncbi:MAG: sulfatase-like hydrolase/transferase [Persicimonas sp.]